MFAFLVSVSCTGVIHSHFPAALAEHGGKWLRVTPFLLRRLFSCYFHEFPLFVIIGQFSRAVENGERAVPIAMDHHPHPDVMAPILVRRDLQFITIHADTVVGIDGPFLLLAKDVIQICPNPGNER